MIGIGIDIYSISKFEKIITKDFLNKYYTDSEISYLSTKNQSYYQSACGIFTAKEAFFKALGRGIAYSMKDISIEHDAYGKPYIKASGNVLNELHSVNYTSIHLSISHDGDNAISFVIIE